MRTHRFIWGVALTVALPGLAFAAHGKPGLWTVSTTMTMADMPQLPPQALAQMKALDMKVPAGPQTYSSQACMTAADVRSDTPPEVAREDSSCRWSNTSMMGSAMSADLVCNGKMQGRGKA